MARKKKVISEQTVNEDQAAQNAASIQTGKAGAMAQAIQTMAGMTKEQLEAFMAQMAAQTGSGAIPDGTAEKNAASIAMKTVTKEELEEIFGSEQLAEESLERVETLFEAAVNARVAVALTEAEEKFEEALQEQTEEIVNTLTEQVDQYLSYVAEEWAKENEVAIESSIRTEIAEQFMDGLRNLFAEHYIDIPDERVDVVESYAQRISELEDTVNALMAENIEYKETVAQVAMQEAFDETATGLSEIQESKFRTLAEGIEFDGDLEKYARKLSIIKEKYFGVKPSERSSVLSEEFDGEEDHRQSVADPNMRAIMEVLSRTAVKK